MKFCIEAQGWSTVLEAESPIEALHEAREDPALPFEPWFVRTQHVRIATKEDIAWFLHQEGQK